MNAAWCWCCRYAGQGWFVVSESLAAALLTPAGKAVMEG